MRKSSIFRLSACLTVVVTLAGYWSVRLAWADRLSRDRGLASRERAVRLAPLSATLHERLADLRDALPDWQTAASLDPANADQFERLGQQAEMAGDFALAERSLLRAVELSRLYQPRYLLAQYYFRRQNRAAWERWSREAFAVAPGDVTPLLELAWRMTPTAASSPGRGSRNGLRWRGSSSISWCATDRRPRRQGLRCISRRLARQRISPRYSDIANRDWRMQT